MPEGDAIHFGIIKISYSVINTVFHLPPAFHVVSAYALPEQRQIVIGIEHPKLPALTDTQLATTIVPQYQARFEGGRQWVHSTGLWIDGVFSSWEDLGEAVETYAAE